MDDNRMIFGLTIFFILIKSINFLMTKSGLPFLYLPYSTKQNAVASGYAVSFMMKTPYGRQNYATFFIGYHQAMAASIFNKLKSNDRESERSILQMDFLSWDKNKTECIATLYCTIDDIALNSRIITRELYKEWT